MTPSGRLLLLAAGTALVAMVATGCSTGTPATPATGGHAPRDAVADPSAGADPSGTGISHYVALGDSYTSAPYVGPTDLAEGCLRSQQNYPRLFAAQQHIDDLVDVSCAGATTHDLAAGQRAPGGHVVIPAQLDALTTKTDLVTLGIGGNDGGLFGRLVRDCTRPRSAQRAGCASVSPSDLAAIGSNVRAALRQVRRRAPHATVVLVGYPRILDGHGCPRRLAVSAADVASLSAVTRDLRDVMAAAARREHVLFLDLYRASAGHDLCSSSPWVNGATNRPMVAAALHPFAAEQHAAARLLTRLLTG